MLATDVVCAVDGPLELREEVLSLVGPSTVTDVLAVAVVDGDLSKELAPDDLDSLDPMLSRVSTGDELRSSGQ